MLPPRELYARTSDFIQMAMAHPALAREATQISVGMIGYFVHVLEFESWCTFRAAVGIRGVQDISARVMEWRTAALCEEDTAAAWGYEIIAINLAATTTPEDPDTALAAQLTDSILRKALAEATPLDHEDPVS